MKLISAEICRDGGSIAADFRLDDGSMLSFLLEVSLGNTPRYGHLHVGSDIQNSCDPSTIIPKGSARESEVLALLDAWKAAQAAAGPGAEASLQMQESIDWANALCSQIEGRVGSAVGASGCERRRPPGALLVIAQAPEPLNTEFAASASNHLNIRRRL